MVGRNLLFLDIVAHRRQQSALVAKLAEHVVEQGGNGCLAVGAGNAHQLELSRRVAVELCGNLSDGVFSRTYLNVGYAFGNLCRHVLAEYCGCSLSHGFADECMAVYLCTLHGYEQMAFGYAARIDVHAFYFYVCASGYVNRVNVLYQFT